MILIVKDYNVESASNADGIVLQSNIDGAVTSADPSAIEGEIVVMSGATGKVIKSSKVNISALNEAIAKAHEHANKDKLDTYTKTQEELLTVASTDAQSKVDKLKETVNDKADKATTLAGYGIEDAYTKTDIDGKLKVIEDNVNTKVDAVTVDAKIKEAKPGILSEAAQAANEALNTKVGDLGESSTVVDYVKRAVGSGGADIAGQIDEALKQAKSYTDNKLTITEF